ncbi:MAG: hypothetical protein KGJ86_00365, partial [Chloroflexota bacterium]|nr:hypothetical protein [Chloroflexota bacterium]
NQQRRPMRITVLFDPAGVFCGSASQGKKIFDAAAGSLMEDEKFVLRRYLGLDVPAASMANYERMTDEVHKKILKSASEKVFKLIPTLGE